MDDCLNGADEDTNSCNPVRISGWYVVDGCADDSPVTWRLWAEERDWVWPGLETSFVTDGLDLTSYEEIECVEGELICFGGDAGEQAWGVGLNRDQSCDDCCFPCAAEVDVGVLDCG